MFTEETETKKRMACYHCGLDCPDRSFTKGDKVFCCNGCLTVYELLEENGLTRFYNLEKTPGVQPREAARLQEFEYLNEASVKEQMLDFSDGRFSRVTFRIPAIHCIACVWLLENLFKLRPGIGRSQVNFPRKEVSIVFEESRISLGELTSFLAGLGYEPELRLETLERKRRSPAGRALYLKIGIAGFAFANIMLMSLPVYFGLDTASGPAFRTFFGYVSLLLALPVLFYSASDYLKAAARYFRNRILTIDFPIALGIVAVFSQSAFDILTGTGGGYLDSFSGLVFFLLCGRWFQQKTYDAISFERDYKSYFPLSVTRRKEETDEVIPISQLEIGDRIVLRNSELIPADAKLVSGEAMIDYSFVTGESDPVEKAEGDYLYAGGRQTGGIIEVEIIKNVSQSYLTSLWNNEAFARDEDAGIYSLTNRVSRYFTAAVVTAAVATALFWLFKDRAIAVRAFSSVLIVACPCALALSAPFTLGTVLRLLGRNRIFAKNGFVIETLARIGHIVFDKTGTLTQSTQTGVTYHGDALAPQERRRVFSLARHSTHPHCIRISEVLSDENFPERVSPFFETPGKGIEGSFGKTEVLLGSRRWLIEKGIDMPVDVNPRKLTSVYLAVDGTFRGWFALSHTYREAVARIVPSLSEQYELSLLSGDNERELDNMRRIFGERASLHFNQTPLDKLEYIRGQQKAGVRVLMVGDGLNDAGALKQSDAGIAISEDIGTFSPASDVIMDADTFPQFENMLRYSRAALRIIWISFVISFIYNVVGIGFAASGHLSPLVSAILMPISSVSIVSFAASAATITGRKLGFP